MVSKQDLTCASKFFNIKNMAENIQYEEVNLADYLGVIFRRKWTVIIFCLIAVIAASVFSFLSPKIYRTESFLEIGMTQKEGAEPKGLALVEEAGQLKEKIKEDIYTILIKEKLGIPDREFPQIKATNPSGTNIMHFSIESSDREKPKVILSELNSLILKNHQETIRPQKEFLEQQIVLFNDKIKNGQQNIERVRAKISALEGEKKNLEAKVLALEKVVPYEQDPGTQFALFDTKEKLEKKKQEIEDRYLEINALEDNINSFQSQINFLNAQLQNIRESHVIIEPFVSDGSIRPNIRLNIALALAIGFLAGTFFAFFKDWWTKNKNRIKSQ